MSRTDTLSPVVGRGRAPARNGGSPRLRPRYTMKETEEAFGVEIFLPGISKEGLDITADQTTVTVIGHKQWKRPEGWNAVYCELPGADFELTLHHENVVDPDRIHAELRDGVLRLTLPKAEEIKPRRIEVS